MKFSTKTTAVCGLLATFALTSLTPAIASPASRQSNKNQWRNLGIAGAVVAGYGLLKHNQTATILGAAGAAYSANRYEQDRHSQSQNNDWRQRYHRTYNNYDNSNNSGNGHTYGWNPGNQGGSNDYQYQNPGNQGRNGYGSYNNSENGKHHGKGWDKNHGSQDNDGDKDRD